MKKPVTEFSDEGPNRWHVNRGVPVVWLIGTVILTAAQFAGLVWYASQFNTRVDVMEKAMTVVAPQGERLTRLEEKVVAVQATANRIEALLTMEKRR